MSAPMCRSAPSAIGGKFQMWYEISPEAKKLFWAQNHPAALCGKRPGTLDAPHPGDPSH